MKITLTEYFAGKPHTQQDEDAATELLAHVNGLCAEASACGAFHERIDVDTGTSISGSRGGSGDGGFRLASATTGKPKSAHKEARAVDKYDPLDELDRWLDVFETGAGGNSKLEMYDLYREAPEATPGWCHLSTRRPASGRRTFYP